MIEIIIALTVAVVLWSVRKAFFTQADVFQEKVELSVKDSAIDLQEDYKAVVDKASSMKAKHGDRWFTMGDIDEVMR